MRFNGAVLITIYQLVCCREKIKALCTTYLYADSFSPDFCIYLEPKAKCEQTGSYLEAIGAFFFDYFVVYCLGLKTEKSPGFN